MLHFKHVIIYILNTLLFFQIQCAPLNKFLIIILYKNEKKLG